MISCEILVNILTILLNIRFDGGGDSMISLKLSCNILKIPLKLTLNLAGGFFFNVLWNRVKCYVGKREGCV